MLFSENLSGVSMQFGETATTSVATLQPLDTISIWPEIQQSLFKRAHLIAVFDISSLQAVVFTNTASVSYRFLQSISYDSSAADGSPQHVVSKRWGSFDDSHLELREAPGLNKKLVTGVRWKMEGPNVSKMFFFVSKEAYRCLLNKTWSSCHFSVVLCKAT